MAAPLLNHRVEGGPPAFQRHSLRFRHQALARLVHGEGSHVFENTRVEEVRAGVPCLARAGGFEITGNQIVHATHTPLGVVLPLQLRIGQQADGDARARFQVGGVPWRWSGEVFEPADGAPASGGWGRGRPWMEPPASPEPA